MNRMIFSLIIGIALTGAPAASAQEAPLRPDQVEFRGLYKELVETDTSVSTGNCTLAAQKMAARLKAAGFAESDLSLFTVPEFPLDGGLVAVLPGTSKTAKPMLLLGHLDVVNARREDWKRDPYQFIEEDGYFYGRGTSDMKAMVATWVDTLARLKKDGTKLKRTIKMALTCGEESGARLNGAKWLAENRPELIAAEFALNEGGGGRSDGKGKVLTQSMQVGEKSNRTYRLETVNAGGHSSIPIDDNAIYQLADAVQKVRGYKFPLRFNDVTRAYFATAGAARGDELGKAMVALAKDPADKAAEAIVSTDRSFNSMLRTTCGATMLDAGHAENALPQRARATVNCRIVPGETAETTRAALGAAIGDAGVSIAVVGRERPIAIQPPLDPRLMKPAQALVAKYFPGVPLIPTMSTGATDATYLGPVGIPTYGVPGGWGDPDGNGSHGLDERRAVRSVYVGRDFLFDLVKAYANAE